MACDKLTEKRGAALVALEEIQARMADSEVITSEDQAAFDRAAEAVEAIDRDITATRQREARIEALRQQNDRVGHAPKLAHEDPANTRNGKHEYSVTRAMSFQAMGREADGIEGEVHRDLTRDLAGRPQGVLVPMSAKIKYRAFDPSGGSFTAVVGSIEDALRSRLVLSALGARSIVNQGVFKIPLGSSGGGYWLTNTAPTKANRSVGALAFSVHTVGGATTADRQSLTQANFDVQPYLMDAIISDIATTYQAGAFHGAGSSGEPLGLFGISGTNVKAMGTNGGALALADLLAIVAASEGGNSPDGQAWVTSPALAAKLEGTVKGSNQSIYLLDAAAKSIIGRPYQTTTSIKSDITKGTGEDLSAIAFGPWEMAIQAFFSAVDIYIDPYTGQNGSVTVTGLLDCDFGVTRPQAFGLCVDAATV